jgi:hypothetical protein
MTDKISPVVQEAVQRVDAQIQHHLDLVQDLKSQRNALMPISRLPTEIIARVFHEVRAGHNGHGRPNGSYIWSAASPNEPSLKWISVSHVSRHWRNVAINDANLWTYLPLKNPKWTMIMLERSRMATIPAITMKVEELDEPTVTTLTHHIPRVSVLVIPNMPRGTLKQVLAGLPSTSPNLEALSINTLVGRGGDMWYNGATSFPFEEAVAFPDNVLCYTPKLKHLALNDLIIKSDSPLLSYLTTLSMRDIPEKSKPTPQQFKTMLESAPCLKRLELKGVCPSTGSNPRKEWTPPVLMQHLEYLDICDTIPRLIYFFRFFSATHFLKQLFIDVKYEEEFASHLSLLFAALDQPYLYSVIGSSRDVRRLLISNTDGEMFIKASKMSILERNLEPSKREMSDASELMTIWIDTSSDHMEDEDLMELSDTFLSDLYNNFTWTGLSELEFTSLDYTSPQLIASTFGTVPQLRIIVTNSAEAAPLLIKALNHCPDTQSNASGSMPLSFPGLQHMNLGWTSLIQGDKNFEALYKCLQQRHECGIPIISLQLHHDRLEEQVFSLLKKYVEHIILMPSGNEYEVVDDYSPYNLTWYM